MPTSKLITLELCSPQATLLLIEELLDSQSIEGCRTVFNFLESRREAIIAVGFIPS
jgi:THO complex subunit 1